MTKPNSKSVISFAKKAIGPKPIQNSKMFLGLRFISGGKGGGKEEKDSGGLGNWEYNR